MHVSAEMRAWIAARQDWPLVYRLLAYAPEINPAEGIWSSLRTKLFDFTVCGIDELTTLIKNRLKPMRYQAGLLSGFITETGLLISESA